MADMGNGFSSFTDTKAKFCFAVLCALRILLFMIIPSMWNNSGDGCITSFSLFDGWDLSPSLYYLSVATCNLTLESGLVSLEWEGNNRACDDIFRSEREENVVIWIASLRLPDWLSEDSQCRQIWNIWRIYLLLFYTMLGNCSCSGRCWTPPVVNKLQQQCVHCPKRELMYPALLEPVSSGTAASQCMITHAHQAMVLQTEARIWRNKILRRLEFSAIIALIKTAFLHKTGWNKAMDSSVWISFVSKWFHHYVDLWCTPFIQFICYAAFHTRQSQSFTGSNLAW